MDIFGRYRKQTMDSYAASYMEKHEKPEFYYLDRKRVSMKLEEQQADNVTAKNRDLIWRELSGFYRMAGDGNPFSYFSKLDFVLQHREAKDPVWSKDLFLRFISDRCLLFYEHRRYACLNGGLHTIIERKRNHGGDSGNSSSGNEPTPEFEPMTPIHMDYYYEYRRNYQTLTEAMEKRKWFTAKSGKLLEELNRLGKRLKTGESDENVKSRDWSGEICTAACTYIASVIWQTSKKEYIEPFEQIFVKEETAAAKAFQAGVRQIAKSIVLPDGTPHCLAPLVLYFIFTRGTKALLQGDIRKFWNDVRRCSKAASIPAMTELSGRKAGVNLALYRKLLNTFSGSGEAFEKDLRSMKLYDGSPSSIEDMGKAQRDMLDFLFNLTTGYGALYHSRAHYGKVKKSLSEICSRAGSGAAEWPVFQYSPDYRRPVDELRFLVRANIDACFANRAEFLTPGTYKQPSRFELAKLSDVLLQDMALPAAERLSRLIQKTLSQHKDILDEYRPFLCKFHESGAVTECLQNIMDTYFPDLDGLMERYLGTEVQHDGYDHRHILRAMVEYEIRHRLYKEGTDILTSVAETVFADERYLFVIGL